MKMLLLKLMTKFQFPIFILLRVATATEGNTDIFFQRVDKQYMELGRKHIGSAETKLFRSLWVDCLPFRGKVCKKFSIFHTICLHAFQNIGTKLLSAIVFLYTFASTWKQWFVDWTFSTWQWLNKHSCEKFKNTFDTRVPCGQNKKYGQFDMRHVLIQGCEKHCKLVRSLSRSPEPHAASIVHFRTALHCLTK